VAPQTGPSDFFQKEIELSQLWDIISFFIFSNAAVQSAMGWNGYYRFAYITLRHNTKNYSELK